MGDAMNERQLVGQGLDAIPTPALIVDAEALEHNLKIMHGWFAGRACRLRPHFKSHKCVTLARRQIAAGNTSGITCAKLSEAEALASGGVEDILIANQVVGREKTRRLAALQKMSLVRCAVDSEANIAELGAAAVEAGVTIGVLVETDIGMGRCGVPPGEPTVALARKVHSTKGLRLDGLQGYEGHLVLNPEKGERAAKTREAMALLTATRKAVRDAGLPCGIVSGGGTGTYDITGAIEGMDEIQAGSYALMDARYKTVRPEFRNALFLLATVISARPGLAVCDVGLKGIASEFGLPLLADHAEAKALYLAEEHAPFQGVSARVGDRLRLVPSHGCTTCNLHRRRWVVRAGRIEAVWPIEASGCLE